LPAVNLGFTSFLDGGPPAGPGIYYAQYFQYYHANTMADNSGNNIFPDPKVDAYVSLSQLLLQCPKKLVLGAQPGLDIILPVVDLDIQDAGPFRANGAGVGDILIGPYLQWEPIMGKKGPIFMHRLELQCMMPSGKYDSQYQLNPGANLFSLNPYWSGTFFATPKLTLSTRAHYLWNTVNDDPSALPYSAYGSWNAAGGNEMRPGQAFHINFATEYELIEKHLRVGFNGYYLRQLTDTELNGSDISDSRERVLGLGPGAMYSFSQNTHLFFNSYFETAAENRPEGMRFQLRLVHHF
jgi:anthranilate 1,2-dioxygenase (deaminating, decarboxylating) large subunit